MKIWKLCDISMKVFSYVHHMHFIPVYRCLFKYILVRLFSIFFSGLWIYFFGVFLLHFPVNISCYHVSLIFTRALLFPVTDSIMYHCCCQDVHESFFHIFLCLSLHYNCLWLFSTSNGGKLLHNCPYKKSISSIFKNAFILLKQRYDVLECETVRYTE